MLGLFRAGYRGIPALGAWIYKVSAGRMLRGFHRVVAEEVSSLVSQGPLLDAGCGTAGLLIEAGRIKCPPQGFIGLDISAAMARIALSEVRKAGLGSCVDLVVGDAHAMPFRSSSVEVAASTGTLHHLPKPPEFFEECRRVARSVCMVYEFSHDVPWREFSEGARRLSMPPLLMKLTSALHGIPRREFVYGAVARALERAGVRHEVVFMGPVTLLRISR